MRGETEIYTPPTPVTIVLVFLLGLWVDSLCFYLSPVLLLLAQGHSSCAFTLFSYINNFSLM